VCEEKRGREKWEGVLCDGRRKEKWRGGRAVRVEQGKEERGVPHERKGK
jgi:hypothetical protein